jgi:hypothetical protein
MCGAPSLPPSPVDRNDQRLRRRSACRRSRMTPAAGCPRTLAAGHGTASAGPRHNQQVRLRRAVGDLLTPLVATGITPPDNRSLVGGLATVGTLAEAVRHYPRCFAPASPQRREVVEPRVAGSGTGDTFSSRGTPVLKTHIGDIPEASKGACEGKPHGVLDRASLPVTG